jgi:hypothetical protein
MNVGLDILRLELDGFSAVVHGLQEVLQLEVGLSPVREESLERGCEQKQQFSYGCKFVKNYLF